MPLVTVLLPNYNNEKFLKECLDSLYNQSFQDFVIYFVDDCSTDQSVAIAKSYPTEKIEITLKESNTGIVDTLNVGLAKIKSKYFIRMDGDDISHPDRFKILVDFMETNQEFGVCSSAIETFGVKKEVWKYQSNPEVNKANLIFGHSVGHASSIFRTDVLTKNKIVYLNRFWRMEDYDLFYRLKDITLTTAIADVLYYYRQDDYNYNPELEFKKNEEFLKFYALILDDLGISHSAIQCEMHLSLAGRLMPNKKLKEYKSHLKIISEQNLIKGLFPKYELQLRCEKALKKVTYKLIDTGNFNFLNLLTLLGSDWQLVLYYLKSKFRTKT